MTVSTERHGTVRTHAPRLDDASIGQLTARMSEQVTRLVRDELALAQLEAKGKAKRLGVGFGLFGAGGGMAFFGAGAAVAAAVLALATVMAPWLAALIVAAGLFLIAGIAALFGKKAVSAATPAMPTQAIKSSKADLAAVRQAVRR